MLQNIKWTLFGHRCLWQCSLTPQVDHAHDWNTDSYIPISQCIPSSENRLKTRFSTKIRRLNSKSGNSIFTHARRFTSVFSRKRSRRFNCANVSLFHMWQKSVKHVHDIVNQRQDLCKLDVIRHGCVVTITYTRRWQQNLLEDKNYKFCRSNENWGRNNSTI